MTSFFIAPYEPTDDPNKWEELKTASNLKIDPVSYRQRLLEKWPYTKFFRTSDTLALQWSLYIETKEGVIVPGSVAALHGDYQVVSLDTPYEEFFLWHRSVIPSVHALFLFNSSSWDSLELTSETTLKETQRFVGCAPG